MRILTSALIGSAALLLSACTGADEAMVAAYDGISEGDTISLGGTEPFWAIAIDGDTLVYSAPETPDGIEARVIRFAGNGGLSFSGELDGKALTVMITPGECNDGMSDRAYPFTTTARWGDSALQGCGYTEQNPFIGEEAP